MSSPKFLFSQHYGVVAVIGRTNGNLLIEPINRSKMTMIVPPSIQESTITSNWQTAKRNTSMWCTKIPTDKRLGITNERLNLLLTY